MSDGPPNPATWPRCLGPLAYGQATAMRIRCGLRFGKAFLRAGLSRGHLTEGLSRRRRGHGDVGPPPEHGAGHEQRHTHEAHETEWKLPPPNRASRFGRRSDL